MTTEGRADLIKDLVAMTLFVALVCLVGFGAVLAAGVLAASGRYGAGIGVFAGGALTVWFLVTVGARWLERWRSR